MYVNIPFLPWIRHGNSPFLGGRHSFIFERYISGGHGAVPRGGPIYLVVETTEALRHLFLSERLAQKADGDQ